jgi:hypothetical protein
LLTAFHVYASFELYAWVTGAAPEHGRITGL